MPQLEQWRALSGFICLHFKQYLKLTNCLSFLLYFFKYNEYYWKYLPTYVYYKISFLRDKYTKFFLQFFPLRLLLTLYCQLESVSERLDSSQ